MYKKKTEPTEPPTRSDIEWKILMNPDRELYSQIKQRINNNKNNCLNKEQKCMCDEFKNSQEENKLCQCGLYLKVRRSDEEKEKFYK